VQSQYTCRHSCTYSSWYSSPMTPLFLTIWYSSGIRVSGRVIACRNECIYTNISNKSEKSNFSRNILIRCSTDMGWMYSVLRYSCTRVQNFRYSYFTRTHVFSRPGTCTHTRTHDQIYSYFSGVSHEYTTLYFSLYCQFSSSQRQSWLKMRRSIPTFLIK